jgi:hypothetical protein
MKAIYHIFIITLISILGGGCNSDMVPSKEADASATGRFTVSVLTEEVTTEDITRGTISNMDVNKFKVSIADAKGLTLVAGKEVGTLEDNDRILPVADDYIDMITSLKREDRLPAIFFIFSKRASKNILNHLDNLYKIIHLFYMLILMLLLIHFQWCI